MSEIIKSLLLSLRKSPDRIVIVLIVGGFLWYLCRKDDINLELKKQGDLVAQQRINHCHSVQEESTKVMDRLNTTLTNHDKAFTHLLYKLDTFIAKMEKTHIKMDALMAKMEILEHHIKENEKPHKDMTKVLQQIMEELELINKKIKE